MDAMKSNFQMTQVAIIGSGIMGAQIAAQFAGAQYKVVLFDLKDDKNANNLVIKGLQQMSRLKPLAYFSKASLSLIQVANLSDDLSILERCDLVIEAVSESIDIKSSVYKLVIPYLHDDAILATNTSGISIRTLANTLPQQIKERFVGLHFFNPPRYVPLVEIITHDTSEQAWLDDLETLLVARLGKKVVYAKDNAAFIANRLGVFTLLAALHHGQRLGLGLDCIDQLTGSLVGRAKSAICRTIDLVGLDILSSVIDTMANGLDKDPWHPWFKMPNWLSSLKDQGFLGQKSGQGIYHKTKEGLLVYDIEAHDYRPIRQSVSLKVKKILLNNSWEKAWVLLSQSKDPQAQYLWSVFAEVWHYAAYFSPHVADHVAAVDHAMVYGFGWERGPFRLWQDGGVELIYNAVNTFIESGQSMNKQRLSPWVDDCLSKGFYDVDVPWQFSAKEAVHLPILPVYQRHHQSLANKHYPLKNHTIVFSNQSAHLWHEDDGVLVLSFTSKMNTIDKGVLEALMQAKSHAQRIDWPLVIWQYNLPHFCAGADLKQFITAFLFGGKRRLNKTIGTFQDSLLALKQAPIPVVAAVRGFALGGGCELLMHCDRVVASVNSYIGLVEVGVGVIPAGGGCKEMVYRASQTLDPGAYLEKALLRISQAKVAQSAYQAKDYGYLQASDIIVHDEDSLLYVAKQQAKAMHDSAYRPQPKRVMHAAGFDFFGRAKARILSMHAGGYILDHDVTVCLTLAKVLAGGLVDSGSEVDEAWLFQIEREGFIELAKTRATQKRVKHMLKYGKPLRN
jgi:3-hydroxyacyl-CoA dehydrogenase